MYAQALCLGQHKQPCATQHFIVWMWRKAEHAVASDQRDTAEVVVWNVEGSVKHGG
jgi:hypothetical protein